MVYWETADRDPSIGATEREFAGIWQALPKVVFSTTLQAVEGNARLARGGIAEELGRVRDEVDGDIAIGGAGLAAEATRLGVVDEYRLFVNPVAVGGVTAFFPLGERIPLELLEMRTFGSRVVYLRYARVR
jgi:dihydrofolate reductase